VEGNTYESTLGPAIATIFYGPSQAIRTTFRHNSAIGGGLRGIILNGRLSNPATEFPDTCTLDSRRLCLSDADCHIPGVDTTSQGGCTGVTSLFVSWPGEDTMVESNTFEGAFTEGGIIVQNSLHSHISGNTFIGPFASGVNQGGIVLSGKQAIETSSVTRNTVTGSGTALFLRRVAATCSASFFGSTIRLNDSTGYTTEVRTSDDYTLPSEFRMQGEATTGGSAAQGSSRLKSCLTVVRSTRMSRTATLMASQSQTRQKACCQPPATDGGLPAGSHPLSVGRKI
jgi:hypothetical protein